MRRVTGWAVVAVLLAALFVWSSGDDGPIVVFDGQSLNRVPTPTYPALAMAGLDVDAANIARNGASWEQLAVDAKTRRDRWARDRYAVLVMVGGTSNVTGGEDGPTIHQRMADYAASAREAGYRYVIAATIQPSTGETAAENAAREDANRLILEDHDAFDEVVDLAGAPGLDDPAGSSYVDGFGHPSQEGARRMADLVRPAIEEALGKAGGRF